MHIRMVVLAAGVVLAGAVDAFAQNVNPPFPDIMRGDANNDSRVDGSDPIYINYWLFQGGLAPPCLDAADANDDGRVDLSDSSYLNSYLFMGGPMPPAPFPGCGQDPTSDSLSCNNSACT
jgi:hypothetical protein